MYDQSFIKLYPGQGDARDARIAHLDELPPLPKGSSAAEWGGRDTGPCLYRDDEVLAYTRQAVAQAVAAEREAVAAMVADLLAEPAGQRIASIIRARGKENSNG